MDEKTCTKCGATKQVTEFQPNKRYRDGYASWCKSCMAQYQRKWGRENVDRRRAISERHKQKHPEKFQACHERYCVDNPDKRNAKNAVMHAVVKGTLPKVSTRLCVVCSEQAEHYHHWSYAPEHWLDVIPVCVKCHKMIHTGEISIENGSRE